MTEDEISMFQLLRCIAKYDRLNVPVALSDSENLSTAVSLPLPAQVKKYMNLLFKY